MPICTQDMQRTWWLEAGTIIVTGPYSQRCVPYLVCSPHIECVDTLDVGDGAASSDDTRARINLEVGLPAAKDGVVDLTIHADVSVQGSYTKNIVTWGEKIRLTWLLMQLKDYL